MKSTLKLSVYLVSIGGFAGFSYSPTIWESFSVITLLKPFRHKTLEERSAEFNGKLMLDGEYDWGELARREVW